MINEKRLISNFVKLAEINSPSKNERQLGDFLINYLASLQLQVFEDKAGKLIGGNCGNLYCQVPSTDSKLLPVAFFAHLDTVTDTTGIKIKVGKDWIQTDGSTILGADDKAGIAIMLELIHQLQEQNLKHGGIEFIFTVGEESGLEGSKHLDLGKIKAKLGFVLDSGDDVGTYVIKAPTEYNLDLKVFGKSAHAGVEPERGINAIYLAAHALSNLPMGRLDEISTFNIGLILGGESTNIVPGFVQLKGELRSLDEERAKRYVIQIEEKFNAKIVKLGGKTEVKYNKTYSGFDVSDNKLINRTLRLAAQKIGIKARAVTRGGASDANILNEKGLTSTNLGLGMKEEHTSKEKIAIKDLTISAKLVLSIIQSLPEIIS